MTLLTRSCLAMLTAFAAASAAPAADEDARIYEMRVYYAAPGKLDALHARFRDHTVKFFKKHGMTNVGYWTPIDNPDQKLVYILSHASRDAAAKSWKALFADPDVQKTFRETEKDGRLATKFEVTYLDATDYSPPIRPSAPGERVFELRTYTTTKGNLGALNSRFRDHTVKLFEKHGMTNVGYWTPMKDQKGAEDTLVYILAHKSPEAAKASFDAFRKDADWVAARKASEEKAGGSLTAPEGVKSVFMKATDYSPIK